MEIDASTRERHRWRIVLITTIAAVAAYYLLPPGMNELARRAATIFLVAAVFWATEVIPLFATSLLVIAMEIFFLADQGGLAGLLPARSVFPPDPNDPTSPLRLNFQQFLEPFSSHIIVLFLGGFLISAAMTKTGVDRVIASKVLRPFAARPVLLVFAVMGVTAFFSMWMSNTATAAMMLAIVSPLLRDLDPKARFGQAIVLAVAFAANIGGLGTPIGSPPNAVALAALRLAGYQISFVDWMLMAVPLMVLLLVVAAGLLIALFPPEKETPIPQFAKVASITPSGRITIIVLTCAILSWLTGNLHGVNPAVVALAAAAALATLGVLDRDDLKRIDWDVLVLMWGGLSLGVAMQITGLVQHLSELPLGSLHGFLLATFVVVITVAASTFISNTAAATLLIPIAMTLGETDAERVLLALLVGISCSFAMAMPVSTPPNALVFASDRVSARSMLVAGTVISVIAVVLLLLGYQMILPRVVSRALS
jgi:solute carrier family 13 (sodium-dependent dicarboxylate transporter), member 2/3/5